MNILKYVKMSINLFCMLIIIILIFIFTMPSNVKIKNSNLKMNIPTFKLNDTSITYSKNNINSPNYSIDRNEVLNRAKEMTQVKWTPKYDLFDKYGHYIFKKGNTYYGIPYSMDYYQTSSINDFLHKINNSKIIYGNDCSGFISICWGVSRQTTLSLLHAVKYHNKIDGKNVIQISWNDLKPGDTLLVDNGKGEGHIMMYINTNPKNSNELNVYEQNIQTTVPFYPVPTARKDTRFKNILIKEGYIPIRLMTMQ